MEKEYKRKQYLDYLPVASKSTADLLKGEAVWKVLRKIREDGLEGIMAKEIAREVREAESTVYAALNRLSDRGFIRGVKISELTPRHVGRPSKEELKLKMRLEKIRGGKTGGKSPKVYFDPCEHRTSLVHTYRREPENPWGDVIFSENFSKYVGSYMEENHEKEMLDLTERLLKFSKVIYQELDKKGGKLRDIMPNQTICEHCEKSHEGNEFIKAIMLYATAHAIDSKECKKLLENLKLASSEI